MWIWDRRYPVKETGNFMSEEEILRFHKEEIFQEFPLVKMQIELNKFHTPSLPLPSGINVGGRFQVKVLF